KTDVMSTGAHPHLLAIELKRRFPDSEMMAAGDDSVGFGLLVTEVLDATEEIKLAHRHLQVVLLLSRHQDGLGDCRRGGAIGNVPVGGTECRLNVLLRTYHDEVHHVTQVVELVVPPARKVIDCLAKLRIGGCVETRKILGKKGSIRPTA